MTYRIIDADGRQLAVANTRNDADGCVAAYRRQGIACGLTGQRVFPEAAESDSPSETLGEVDEEHWLK